MSLGSMGTCLNARLMSILEITECLPNLFTALTMWPIGGRGRTKYIFPGNKFSNVSFYSRNQTSLKVGFQKVVVEISLVEGFS